MKVIFMVWLILSSSAFAKNLGVFGPTYNILERDAYDWLVNNRLNDVAVVDKVKQLESEMSKTARVRIENPKGAKLRHATKYYRREIGLTNTLPVDIKTANGKTLFKKGTSVKFEDVVPESKMTLLFIDGDDNRQVQFAINELNANKFIKIVLVNGKPLKLMRDLNVNFYFDQGQALINKFGIQRLPTRIHREQSKLIVEELAIND